MRVTRRIRTWLAVGLGAAASAAAEPFDVGVNGPTPSDPLILLGEYTPPREAGGPVLIALHGLGSTAAEWDSLAAAAARRGWGVYRYDLRGHGRSRATLRGRPIDYQDKRVGQTPAFWRAMPTDLARVAAALETQKGVTADRRVLVGASLGANTCFIAAAEGLACAKLVLLSPGMDYAGLTLDEAAPRVTAPTLLISARPDTYAHVSAERLLRLAPPGVVTRRSLEKGTPRGDHGTQLFDGKLEDEILDWIAGTAPAKKSGGQRPTPKR